MKRVANLLWALVLIVIGVILGLNALDITNINIFFDGWWTLIIIIPCFIGLFKDKNKTFDLIGLLVGVLLLLMANDFLSISLIRKLALPIILVSIGLWLLLKDFVDSKTSKLIKQANSAPDTKIEDIAAVFTTQNVALVGQEFTGATLNSVFGTINLDLSRANISKDRVINVTCVFGSANIYVPKDCNVIVKSTLIFGGVSNKTKEKNLENTLYINGTCIFGGVDIYDYNAKNN